MKEIIYKSIESENIRTTNNIEIGYYAFRLVTINYDNELINLSIDVTCINNEGKIIKYFDRNYESSNIISKKYDFNQENLDTILRRINSDNFYSFLKNNNYYGFTEFEEIL